MRRRRLASARPLLFLLVLAPRSAGAAEFALSYLAVPATVEYVETDLVSGAREPKNASESLGAVGLVVTLPLRERIGPFQAAVQSGFATPAGARSFDHRRLVRNAGGRPRNATHEGDFTAWAAGAVPLLAALRWSKPSETVTFDAEVGAGAMFLAVSSETTEAVYDPSDTSVASREIRRRQDLALSPAVAVSGGLVIPASPALNLTLDAGLVWIAEAPFATTDTAANPVLIYGASTASPGLILGGLGFLLRLGLATAW